MAERFSASNAAKHMACHASANLEKAIPNWTEPVIDLTKPAASRRGTDMHDHLDKFAELSAKEIKAAGRALMYVGNVRSLRRFNVLHEVAVQATWLTVPTLTTVDLCFYVADEIHVIDYKTGKIPVSVHDNDQLKFYARTLVELAPKATEVHLHIVQPWADEWDEADAEEIISARDLHDWGIEAVAAQDAILGGSKTFGPSDHCKFCAANPHSRSPKGKPLCPEMMQLLYPQHIDEDEILGM